VQFFRQRDQDLFRQAGIRPRILLGRLPIGQFVALCPRGHMLMPTRHQSLPWRFFRPLPQIMRRMFSNRRPDEALCMDANGERSPLIIVLHFEPEHCHTAFLECTTL
jgi:hypothetical protein